MTASATRNRRGFTLVELLIVMVILGVVGAAFVRALTSASRVSQAQAEKSNMQANLRAGGGLLPSELREINIDASSTDLLGLSRDSIAYRAMRRLGLACAASGTTVKVRNTNSFGLSNYAVGDRLLLFVENVDSTTTDDSWVILGVSSLMAIGGFSGGDNSPTLAQFQSYVADHQVRYFIASDHRGPMHGKSGPAQQISEWVSQHFTAMNVGGTTVYDLNQQPH